MRFSKLFGIGLPRTGTTSLNLALNAIGISSIHFPFGLYETDHRNILNEYQAFVDTPIPLLSEELDRLYPNAGFVLTTRPIKDWLNSMEWLLTEGRQIWPWREEYDEYNQQFFGSADFETDLYQDCYEKYHARMYKYFEGRKDLLILDLAKGYGYQELCQFLDVPIYQGKYPRGNESRQSTWLQRIAYRAGQYSKSLEFLFRRLNHYQQRTKQLTPFR